MKRMPKGLVSAIAVVAVCLGASGCDFNKSMEDKAESGRTAANLSNFDDLDYNVFSGQKWEEFQRSHSQDIIVHWPDGHSTKGLKKHIEDLKAMFVWAPDSRVKEHPVKVAQGKWTAVIGIMEGTFTQPMPMPDGTSIPPTGMAFKLRMSTFGHWTDEGVMDEEYLFWDNQEFMKQIGLGK